MPIKKNFIYGRQQRKCDSIFGWISLTTPSFLFNSHDDPLLFRFSLALERCCLPPPPWMSNPPLWGAWDLPCFKGTLSSISLESLSSCKPCSRFHTYFHNKAVVESKEFLWASNNTFRQPSIGKQRKMPLRNFVAAIMNLVRAPLLPIHLWKVCSFIKNMCSSRFSLACNSAAPSQRTQHVTQTSLITSVGAVLDTLLYLRLPAMYPIPGALCCLTCSLADASRRSAPMHGWLLPKPIITGAVSESTCAHRPIFAQDKTRKW